MANKNIEENLSHLTQGALDLGKHREQFNPGFKDQEYKVYIWNVKDFYNKRRATINSLDNRVFLWRATLEKELTITILSKNKQSGNTNFLTTNVGTTSIEIKALFPEILNDNENTYIVTLSEDIEKLKNEDIFIINSSNDPGSQRHNYEYVLQDLWAMELGENSHIKVIDDKRVPKAASNFKKVDLKLPNDVFLNSFNIGANATISNVTPVKFQISSAENGNVIPYFPWKNRAWIMDYQTLDGLREGSGLTGSINFSLQKALTFDELVYEPLVNLVKKIINISYSAISGFQRTKKDASGSDTGAQETAGYYWKTNLDGKNRQEIGAILNQMIEQHLLAWEQNQDYGEITNLDPRGAIKVLDSAYSISQDKIDRMQSILCMLSERVYSPYSIAGGVNEFAKYMLPYYFDYHQSIATFNDKLSMYVINNPNFQLKSLYYTFGYPLFTAEQIKRFNLGQPVTDYVNYRQGNFTNEQLYGPINPYIKDSTLITAESKTFELTNPNNRILYSSTSPTLSDFGYSDDPVVIALFKTVSENTPGGQIENEDFSSPSNYKVVQRHYTNAVLSIGGREQVTLTSFPVTPITVEDIGTYKYLGLGLYEDGGPSPDSYNTGITAPGDNNPDDNHVVFLNWEPVANEYQKIINSPGITLIGNPVANLKTRVINNRVDSSELEFSLAVVDSFTITFNTLVTDETGIITQVARSKGTDIATVNRQIQETIDIRPRFDRKLENGVTIVKLRSQEAEITKLPVILEQTEYTSLPSAIESAQVIQNWIWVPVNETVGIETQFNAMINGDRTILDTTLEENNYSIVINSDNYKPSRLVYKHFGAGKGQININRVLKIDIPIGDIADKTVAETVIVFESPEKER